MEKLKITEKDSLLKKMVSRELLKHCEKEPTFKEKILNEKKTLDKCVEYLYVCAKKEAGGQRVYGADDQTILSWAIHYFDEEELEQITPEPTRITKEVKKEVKRNDKSRTNQNQLSLFDF